jgi:hypothetical protein
MNGTEAREATLEAIHSDQLGLVDQLRDLSNILTRIEEHLMGGPSMQMAGAAAAQAKASIGPGQVVPLQGGLISPQPPMPGMLPQMCELGLNNSHTVNDMQSRLANISRLLGVPNV